LIQEPKEDQMKVRLFPASILAAAAALALATNALAVTVVQVSGKSSPYAGCSQPPQAGINFPNAEVEPQVAVNPTNTSNIVGQWHQDRWSNGGARGIAGAYSFTGGAGWNDVTVPYTNCAPSGLLYQRGSDPWVSFGPDGTAYSSALSFDGDFQRNAVSATVSHDGGKTWIHQQTLVANPTVQFSTDKNSTTADPIHPGVAYTVWDTLNAPTSQPDDRIHAAAYTGPAILSKTTDFGVTWSTPQTIIGTGNRQQTIGNIIVIDSKTDTLYDFTDLIVPPNTPKQGAASLAEVAFVKSTDGGTTWTAPEVIAPFNAAGVIDPNTGRRARVGDGLQEVAIDASGKLYVVWESSTNFDKNLNQAVGTFDNEVLFTSSGDGGATWSTPSAIVGPSTLPIFTPTVAVDGKGNLAVTYYDSHSLSTTNTTTWPVDYQVIYRKAGETSFSPPQQIAGPFDLMSAPVARGFFLGDYEGLQSTGTKSFIAMFVTTNCNLNPSDPNAPPAGNQPCGPASSVTSPNPNNTDPTNVFSAALSAP
jgi:hypothetical protein